MGYIFLKEFIISNRREVRIAQNHTFQKVYYLHKNLSLIPYRKIQQIKWEFTNLSSVRNDHS